MSEIARVVRGAVPLAIADIANRLSGLVVAILVSRRFGAVGLGQVSVALALASYVQVAADFGYKTAGARLIAAMPTKWSAIAESTHGARVRLVAAGAAGVCIYWLLSADFRSQETALLILLLLGQIFVAITDDWMLWGHGLMAALAGYRMIVQLGGALCGILLMYAVGQPWPIGLGCAIASIMGYAYILGRIRRTAGTAAFAHEAGAQTLDIRRQLRFKRVAPLGGTTILTLLYQTGELLVLQVLVSWRAVGTYSAASKIIVSACALVSVVGQVIFPLLVRSRAAGTAARVQTRLFPAVLIFGAALSVGLAVFAHPLIALIYGDKLAGAAPFLRGLAPCVALDSACTLWIVARNAEGRFIDGLRLASLGAACTVGMGAVAVEYFGILSIVVVKLAAYVLMCSVILLQWRREIARSAVGAGAR